MGVAAILGAATDGSRLEADRRAHQPETAPPLRWPCPLPFPMTGLPRIKSPVRSCRSERCISSELSVCVSAVAVHGDETGCDVGWRCHFDDSDAGGARSRCAFVRRAGARGTGRVRAVYQVDVRSPVRRLAVVLVSAAACTAAPAVLPQGSSPSPCSFEGTGEEVTYRAGGAVLGRFWVRQTDSDEIAWVDPVTLRRTSAYRAALPQQTDLWAVSPGGGLVATALRREIRIIDTGTLTLVGRTSIDRGVHALAWLSNDVLAGLSSGTAILWNSEGDELRSFELAPGERVTEWRSAAGRLIALVTPDARGGFGSPRLLEISEASMEAVELDRIAAGFDPDLGEHGTLLTPGLAYDQVGRRVFVVPPAGRIADVDLRGSRVSYHSPGTSLLGSVAAALVSPASAKLSSWADIRAAWLGRGLLAVSGYSGGVVADDGEAVGVTIIDTRDWTACRLETGPTRIAVTGGALLAWGGADFGEHGGVGLIIYDLSDGRRRHLYGRQWLDVQVHGSYAYAINSWSGWRVSTIDVSTGRILAEWDRRPPAVLPSGSSVQGW